MSESPLQIIRPVVVPAQFFVFGLLYPGLVVAPLLLLLWLNWGSGPSVLGVLAAIMGLLTAVLAVFSVAAAAVRFLIEPRYAEYKVFSDRVEYQGGFFIRRLRTVTFDQEMDVRLEEGLLQRAKRVGTVKLVTSELVSGQDGQLTKNRFAMWNVPEPQQVYDLIRSLVRRKPQATGQETGIKRDIVE
jgi:hypothetical protein